MKIYHIAALSENNVIGRKGKIPWQIKDDLRRFKEITLGHPVIMGRSTFESMLPYAPLPFRRNIVLTSKNHLFFDGRPICKKKDGVIPIHDDKGEGTELAVANSVGEAIDLCGPTNEVYIIGGSSVYEETLEMADELRLTLVHKEIEGGDTFYPELDAEIWVPSFVEPHETHTYIDYVRKDIRG